MTMLEYNNGPVLFAPVGEEAFLVIVADKDTNLGWIRIAIKKNSKRIQEVSLRCNWKQPGRVRAESGPRNSLLPERDQTFAFLQSALLL